MTTEHEEKKQLLVRVAPEIATDVRIEAAKQNVSMSNLLERFIIEQFRPWIIESTAVTPPPAIALHAHAGGQ